MKLVLASKSPRRRELLKMLGFDNFSVIPAADPENLPEGLSPAETVCAIAKSKAREVASRTDGDSLVLAADTLVYLDGAFLGKPENEEDARAMLKRLSGNRHTVYTGVAVCIGGRELCEAEASDVYFRTLSDEEISDYIATGEPMDKAGAYGAQGLGSLFVQRIEGDFFNVMGLPLCRLGLMLRALGIEILG